MQPQALDDNEFAILPHYLPMNDIESINHFEMLIASDAGAILQFVSRTLYCY